MNSLAKALRNQNVDCQALSFDTYRSPYNHYDLIHCIYQPVQSRFRIIRQLHYILLFLLSPAPLIRRLLWADVVIHFSQPNFCLKNIVSPKVEAWVNAWLVRLIGRMVKTKMVWYTGSDIRDPGKELQINRFFHHAYSDDNYEYKSWESAANSTWVQTLFHRNGFVPIVWDMEQHLLYRDQLYFIIPHTSYNKPVEAKPADKKQIKIVHAPSARVAKGSKFVIKAIDTLKAEVDLSFEFVLLEHLPNERYVQELATADILVDQLIWGAYGVAAQQSMAAGVIVVAYLSDDRLKTIYKSCDAMVNATVDNLANRLRELITASDLSERKAASIACYNRVHHPDVVAGKVMACINDLQVQVPVAAQQSTH